MSVYLRDKFQVSSVTVTSFRLEGVSYHPKKRTPKKPTQIRIKYLSQEVNNNVLDLIKQKGFYSYEYMSDFQKFKEEFPSVEKFYSSLIQVLLLANVFEKCRNNSLKNYLSAPDLSWNAIIKMTKVEVELIPDHDMNIYFEKGTRA